MLRKINYILILLLILTGSVFAQDLPSGKWVATGSLIPEQAYIVTANVNSDWLVIPFHSYVGFVDKWVDALNTEPLTRPPVTLYLCQEGIISLIQAPWKWVPESI